MHAYAGEDPVFLAMNKRGQEQTNGQLGTFCVNCHAPMAVRDGLTTDGLNLAELDKKYRGVTCYFCHQIDAVEADHNAKVRIADDGIMRGSFDDAASNDAHESMYSPLHDRSKLESSSMCGACHDIINDNGVALERTFSEWKGTLFADPNSREALSCAACHMPGMNGLAAENVSDVKFRRVKSHMFPGVDVALTPFPELEEQRAAVQRELDTTLLVSSCFVQPAADLMGFELHYELDNVAAGHSWPSGAAQDRRAWVEVVATFNGNVVFSSGAFADDQAINTEEEGLFFFGDKIFDKDDHLAHDFWAATRFESNLIPGPVTRDATDPRFLDTHVKKIYKIPGPRPDLITIRTRIRPMDFDVLDGLVESGHLAADIRGRMPTFDLGATRMEWRPPDGPDPRANCVHVSE